MDINKEILPWLPTILTLLGWFVVNHHNNNRENKKDARNATDKCKSLAREATQLGIKYWEGKGEVAAWQVRIVLEEIEIEIKRLRKNKQYKQLQNSYSTFIDAIMCDDFDMENYKHKASTDRAIQNIIKMRQSFLEEVESQFENNNQ